MAKFGFLSVLEEELDKHFTFDYAIGPGAGLKACPGGVFVHVHSPRHKGWNWNV